jgi:hypothetical protein
MWGIGHVVRQMYNLSTKWGEWSASCPNHFLTLKEFLLPIKYEADPAQNFGEEEQLLPVLEIKP